MKFEELTNLKTLIRADSSAEIGHGHIRRDLVLAKKFKDISFACLPLAGDLIAEIPYLVFTLQNGSIDELVAIINEQNFELVFIDHYGFTPKDEKAIKERTSAKICCFDDTYEPHFCDFVLNVNLYADAKKYQNLLPAQCEVFCGENFMLVRDEFYAEREKKREKIYDFCIAFGGTDTLNLSQKVALALLHKNAKFKLAIITTSANKNLKDLKMLAKIYPNLSLFIGSNEVAKLMNESRELIIQASSLVNEAIVLRAKFKAVKTAQNQDEMAQWLGENGYEIFDASKICASL